jgi:hypothetical protein
MRGEDHSRFQGLLDGDEAVGMGGEALYRRLLPMKDHIVSGTGQSTLVGVSNVL